MSTVRLTRRGRVVVLVLLVCLAGGATALAATASDAAAPPVQGRTVVGRPGESLWTIVERYQRGSDPFAAIEAIRRLNKLDGYTVYPGEELTLPPAR